MIIEIPDKKIKDWLLSELFSGIGGIFEELRPQNNKREIIDYLIKQYHPQIDMPKISKEELKAAVLDKMAESLLLKDKEQE